MFQSCMCVDLSADTYGKQKHQNFMEQELNKSGSEFH